jgi:hypothetical protein
MSTLASTDVPPTVANTMGAVLVGWGVSSLSVLLSRDRPLHSHLAYTTASSACFVFKSGPTTNDTQMTVLRISFWCVDANTTLLVGLADPRRAQVLLVWYALPARFHRGLDST